MTVPAFISLNGIDGTGKSTQCKMLVDWLTSSGINCDHFVDPGGTELGSQLRQILLDNRSKISSRAEALLFMASRSQLVEEKIRPALEAGRLVITDRYLVSNLAYQGYGNGLPLDELRVIGDFCTEGIHPGLTFIFDLPVEEAVARRRRPEDRLEARSLDYHRKVGEGFLSEAKRDPQRHIVIDARQSIEAIQAELRIHTSVFLKSIGFPDAEKLNL